MSFYRNVYLKSEEWKSLRMESIFKDRFRCKLCGVRPKKKGGSIFDKFQVHHVKYKRLFDVTSGDLKTLCPECHVRVHQLMDKYPKMKTLPRKVLWQTVVYHLRPDKRPALAGQVQGIDEGGKTCRQKHEPIPVSILDQRKFQNKSATVYEMFGAVRKNLFSRGLICKNRMTWNQRCENNETLIGALSDPDEFLQAYIYETHQDPRRLIPVLWRVHVR